MVIALRRRFQFHRDLRALRGTAEAETDALLDAWAARDVAAIGPLAMGVFDRLEASLGLLDDLPERDEDETLSEETIADLARLAAVAVHAHVASRHEAGRLAAGGGAGAEVSGEVVAALRRAEAAYASALIDTRLGARTGAVSRLQGATMACLGLARAELSFAAHALAGQGPEARGAGAAGVRLAEIARRVAMLCGASLQLSFRMTNRRKAAGLRQVAENRARLARPVPCLQTARPLPPAAPEPGTTLWSQVRAEALAWVAESEEAEPWEGHSEVAVAPVGGIATLRLRRRNLQRIGVAAGSWLVLEGVVTEVAEDPGGARHLRIGTRSIAEDARSVWEDYLVEEMRPSYDLRPGSVDMAWEFPALSEIGALNDLIGRL